VWSLRHRGERHNFIRPDDGTPSSYIDVVILGQAKQKSKSFYKKYDPNTSDGDRPICSSIDGVTPDQDVTTKQSETCALCPRNVWKTDPATGRKGRECTDYKRLAVLVLPTQTKPLLGQPLMEPLFLRVPPASLNSLAIMGETMANQGFHFSTYITRISFDPNEAHPKMIFTPLQGLTDKEAPIILELRGDPTVGRITGGDLVIGGSVQEMEVMPPASPATGLAGNTPSTTAEATQPAQTPPAVSPPAASAPLATPADTTTSPASPATVDTGFGGATSASPLTPKPALQTVADTGPPEESDADLDARIAGLIQTQ
jgi:hypothetical protein